MYHFDMRRDLYVVLIFLFSLIQTGCLNTATFESSDKSESQTESSEPAKDLQSDEEAQQIAGPQTGDSRLISGGLKYVVFDSKNRCRGSKVSDEIQLDLVSGRLTNTLTDCETDVFEVPIVDFEQIDPTRILYLNQIYILKEIVDFLNCENYETPKLLENGQWVCESTFSTTSTSEPSSKLIKCSASEINESENLACARASEFEATENLSGVRYFPFLCYDHSGRPTSAQLKFDAGRWKYNENFGESIGWQDCRKDLPVLVIDLQGMNGYQSLFELSCQNSKFKKTVFDSENLKKSDFPSDVEEVLVFLWGAGGSGAKHTHWTGDGGKAGGGGGGQAKFAVFRVSDLPEVISVKVGHASDLGDINQNDHAYGVFGQDTSFGELLVAFGGRGGNEDNFDGVGGYGGGNRVIAYSPRDWQGLPQIYNGGTGGKGERQSDGGALAGSGSLFGGSGGSAAGRVEAVTSRFGGSGGAGAYNSSDAGDGQFPGGGGGGTEDGSIGKGANGAAIIMSWCD